MASFSIDEVRESFVADVTRFLAKIEESTRALQRTGGVTVSPAMLTATTARFSSVAIHAHSVTGTTSLVGVDSLADSARLLEELAETGRCIVDEIAARNDMLVQLVELCVAGHASMQQMYVHELAKESSGASALADGWRAQVMTFKSKVAPAHTKTLPPESAALAASKRLETAADQELNGELHELFQMEARESVAALGSHLRGLLQTPTPARAEPIERAFHQLKGAAAAVGFTAVTEQMRNLQVRVAKVVDGEVPLTPSFIESLLADTSHAFEVAGIKDVKLIPDAVSPEVRANFVAEAVRICREAVGQASSATGDADRRRVAGLFVSLKNAAIKVSEVAVAEAAARAEVACQTDRVGLAQAIAQPVKQILSLIGREDALLGAARAPEPSPAPAEVRVPCTVVADGDLWESFGQECAELLDGLDASILELDTTDRAPRVLADLMRLYHTLKGSVNTVGIIPLGTALHGVENLIEGLLERPSLPALRPIATFLLSIQSVVRRGLKTAPEGYVSISLPQIDGQIAKLSQMSVESATPTGSPSSKLAAHGILPQPPREEPSQAGPVAASIEGVPANETGFDDRGERRYIRVPRERLDNIMNLAGELVVGRSRLVGRARLLKEIQQDLALSQRRLIQTVERFAAQNEFANLDGRRHARRGVRPVRTAGGTSALAPVLEAESQSEARGAWGAFGALELDRYEDVHILSRSLLEITTDFAEMDVQLSRELRNFHDDSDRFGTIVSGIQGEVTRARMVPLDSLFMRLRIAVRDAADRDGKDVRVITRGDDVSLDKTIADALYGPLLHLVRNAVAHGVESPEVRRVRRKAAHGTITVTARQESGQILLEVSDDGAGLDLVALRERGLSMGLIEADVAMDDRSVKELVFAPGLSTSTSANDVSGRGIGGNVVRRAIERLNGDIAVDTTGGVGTRFSIKLPLTLAIARAVLVRSGDQSYAFPMNFTDGIFQLEPGIVLSSAGVRRMAIGDVFVTVRHLDQLLGRASSDRVRDQGAVVLLRVGSDALAVQVDAILGQEEIVVKPLGPVLEGHALFAGVTIQGTGDLALIVDVPGAVAKATGRARAPREAPRELPALPEFGGESRPQTPKEQEGTQASPAQLAAAGVDNPMLEAVLKTLAAAPPQLSVLFIDDSVSVRKVAERALSELGAQVTVAVDGVDGVSKLRGGNFDLVITDLEMPRMNGYEFLREVRFIPAYQNLPVVVISSRSGQKHQEQARSLGATEYLTKPFSVDSLRTVLDRHGRGTSRGK